MNPEIDVFLSDEFVSFSSGMNEIHQKKKEKQEAAKQIFEQLKSEMKAYDEQATKLKNGWDEFVKSSTEPKKNSTERK